MRQNCKIAIVSTSFHNSPIAIAFKIHIYFASCTQITCTAHEAVAIYSSKLV